MQRKNGKKIQHQFLYAIFSDSLFVNQQKDKIAFTISIPKPMNKNREGWSKNRTETQRAFDIFLNKFYKNRMTTKYQ